MVERSGVLTDGAAMGIEQSGNFFAGSVVEGFVEIAGDDGAIFAFEVNVVGWGQAKLRE